MSEYKSSLAVCVHAEKVVQDVRCGQQGSTLFSKGIYGFPSEMGVILRP
jgi:hypothetical protein